MIVRRSLDELPAILAELGSGRPFVVATHRWDAVAAPFAASGRWTEVPSDRIELPPGADAIVAIGGGSAIDTAKAASAVSGLPVVSVPTTYSGAEWAGFFGVRAPDRRIVGGGSGARLAGIVYDVELTLDLPREATVGTALNALAHCAEALYLDRRTERSDTCALEGAATIARSLPLVVATPHDRLARTELLAGAALAGEALSIAGLALAHAIAQALGGSFGLPHGAMNAIALPAALRFNRAFVPDAVAAFGRAIGDETDPAGAVERLAALGGIGRLRDFGIARDRLPEAAAFAAGRAGNRNNPHPATVAEILGVLESII